VKQGLFLAVASLALPLSALAADNHEEHHHAMPMVANQADAAMTDGTVKKVDKAAGKLTVSHGPLPNGMPAMTMAFSVKDPGWLERVKPGDRIRFVEENLKGAATIVHLEPVR